MWGTFMRRRIAVLALSLFVIMVVAASINKREVVVEKITEVQNMRKFPAKRGPGTQLDEPFQVGCAIPDTTLPRENATFLILAQNKDLNQLSTSLSSVERHFNRWFHYPYLILNDEPFSEEFKNGIRQFLSGDVEFGIVPKTDWDFPSDVKSEWVQDALTDQSDKSLPYGPLKSYHQMCRFFSGKFYRHPLLQKYKWYWRVEPDIQFFCDVTYDVFREMEQNGKSYGFNVLAMEFQATIPNLFRYTHAFKEANNLPSTDLWNAFTTCPKASSKRQKDLGYDHNPAMDGCKYTGCHFWTNFEIARVDMWSNSIYEDYFAYLESKGGFWKERWGDAPVHTLGAALFMNSSDIHYFRDIGYSHTGIGHDPGNAPGKQIPLSQDPYNVNDPLWAKPDPEVRNGVGCRCKRPSQLNDFEHTECFKLTKQLMVNEIEADE